MKEEVHHCLIVEDDTEMASELKDLMEAMGFAHTHVETREAALTCIETTEFCFILLDLEIKANAESIRARVVTGYELLRAIRQRTPPGIEPHALPIIVVSAHAKEKDEIFKTARMGATAMIHKPLDTDELEREICRVLQEAGRGKHSECPKFAATITVEVSGDRKKKRTEITINGKSTWLTDGSLSIFLQLIYARRACGGWVDKDDLGVKEGSQKIRRLREDLSKALPDDIIENDREGGYRLSPTVSIGHVNFSLLIKNPEKAIQTVVRQIEALNGHYD